ncbi:hypothetical protein [Moritella viscosa]|uniref:Uncharacterized protein n=1 Tax=Moritella viscosa TaxID=80854 RepID=A0ABY1HCK5_9GAMM|nr:hypothetical protein [Moritella viscosa]SGY85184.1 Putative uncharacterized protein [Moritella viscosa]SGY87437.1 Putative uncharacterized protein [Moritella viscosa]SHO04133.1 Putative uncharacterized protein [Moritella viscosa]SHO24715.1 Putative uncharacterized protein [Moritella viscosa]
MKNPVLEEIKAFAVKRLKETYGYCGVADGEDVAMINSDDRNGFDIKITIKVEPE